VLGFQPVDCQSLDGMLQLQIYEGFLEGFGFGQHHEAMMQGDLFLHHPDHL
jgi:hypothetical protein